jgi:ABC-type xylose transport system permease subunit
MSGAQEPLAFVLPLTLKAALVVGVHLGAVEEFWVASQFEEAALRRHLAR